MLAYFELLLPCLVVLLSKADSITFNVTPIPKVCEEGPLPSTFSIICTVDDNTAVLSWVITGTTTPLGGPIGRGYDKIPFKYPQPTSPGEATLYVQDSNHSEVVIGTCFQCRATVGHKPTDSEEQCLSAVGQPMACELTLTVGTEVEYGRNSIPVYSLSPVSSCKITWSQPLTEFSYNIIDGEVEDGRYSITINNITMNRSSVVNIELRMIEACASNVTVLRIPVRSAPAPGIPLSPGEVAVITVGVVVSILFLAGPLMIIIIIKLKKKQGKLSSSSEERLMTVPNNREEMQDKKEQNKKEELTYVTVDIRDAPPAEAVEYTGGQFATLDTTYAAPDKDRAATEGGDGVYSYAATTTVVGAKHSKQGGETKATENVSVQPEKPRDSKTQPPLSDVPHKQGPNGDLYAMPDKKAPEVGHKTGPQGDMYAVTANPPKGDYGTEGPT